MVIHFFTKGDVNVPSSRQRAYLLSKELKKHKIETIVHAPSVDSISQTAWPKKLYLILQAVKALSQIKNGDVIFLQRTIYNKYFFILICLYKFLFRRKIIFDFDDAIFLHSLFKTKILVKISDLVIVGSHELLEWAGKYNKRVYFIPTCTNFTSFPVKNSFSGESEALILGWAGNSSAHSDNLKLLAPILKEIIKNNIKIKFFLAGATNNKKILDIFKSIEGLDMKVIEWMAPEKVLDIIHTFDVGLMPLVDNPWNRGKCAWKIVEYMACGVPAIGSCVGENKYIIKDGINGFLPKTVEDWVSVVRKISENKKILSSLGAQARKTIEDFYSFDAQVKNIIEIINK